MADIEKKQTTFRGKTIDELKTLGVREFAKFAPARTRRTILREFQDIENFVNRSVKKLDNGKLIRTHKRYLPIVPQMVGMKINIHNGKTFVPVIIIEEMLGHKLGEFALTRGKTKHGAAGVGATKGSKFKAKK